MKTTPRLNLRADYLDIYLETNALLQYRNWIEDVSNPAALCVDRERKRIFYRLHKVVEEDAEAATMEFLRKHAECFPASAVAPEAALARRLLMEGQESSIIDLPPQ